MRITRIYQPPAIAIDQELELTSAASHHLARVLRASTGDVLQVFDGQGHEYQAHITAITKHTVVVKINKELILTTESPLHIHLGQCLARGEKMDFIIQKAVELGIHKITPLFSEYSEVKLDQERAAKKLAHWQTIIINACEQAGRNYLPIILPPISLTTWLSKVDSEFKFIFHPQTNNPPPTLSNPKNIAIAIGPEGGFSAKEIQLAIQSGFHPLTLGPRILRAETAGLAAITALQAKWGDLACV